MILSLNTPSANALRTFAEAMPVAIQNIVESTDKLVRVQQSVADELGVHVQDFYDMLMLIKKAQEETAEAIQVLPQMLIRTAGKIDDYVATHQTVESN